MAEVMRLGEQQRPSVNLSAGPHRWLGRALALGLALLAAGMVWAATPKGLMVTTDSVAYLQAAENLLQGRGLGLFSGEGQVKPLVHFPPLYPLLLAALGALGLPLLEAARALNALLYGGTVLLGWWLLWRHTGSQTWSLLGAGVLATSPILLAEHTRAMSEPIYLLLSLAALDALVEAARRPGWAWAFVAGALVGLAYLTRYVGASLVLTGAVVIGLQRGVSASERGRRLAAFLLPAFGSQAVWMARNWRLAGTATNRTFAWHPPAPAFLKRPIGLLWDWLLPFKFTYPALLGSLALLAAAGLLLALWAWRSRERLLSEALARLASPGLAWVCGLYAALYLAVLVGTIVFLDASTPFDRRLTAPVYLALALALFALIPGWFEGRRAAWAAAMVGALLLSYSLRSADLAAAMRQSPGGLGFEGWQDSGALQAAAALPESMVFYTDDPQALWFYTRRTGYLFPQSRDPVTQRARTDFQRALDRLVERAREGCVGVVLFDRDPTPAAQARLASAGLRRIAADRVAEVFVVGPLGCELGGGG